MPCSSATRPCASISRRSATRERRSTPGSHSPPTTSRSSWSSPGDDTPVTPRLAVASVLTLGLAGCAHANLEGSDLDKVQHPAFVSRVADEAGPRVTVYRSDSAQAAKLGATSPADADRKLEESLKPVL